MKRDRFPILWLTGNSGAGKTTLAMGIRDNFNGDLGQGTILDRRIVVLDGDEMRATISTEEGLSPEDRRRHNLRVARLAKLLQEHGFCVVVAVIAPFEQVRMEISSFCHPLWIYVKRSNLSGPDRPYEPPAYPVLVIDNDRCSIEQARDALVSFLLHCCLRESAMATRDVWNEMNPNFSR
jgi:adenylylsulfate kinase